MQQQGAFSGLAHFQVLPGLTGGSVASHYRLLWSTKQSVRMLIRAGGAPHTLKRRMEVGVPMMPASTDREVVAALGSSTFCRLCDSSTSGTTCGTRGGRPAAMKLGQRWRRCRRQSKRVVRLAGPIAVVSAAAHGGKGLQALQLG